jgi:hypothetical protein
MTMVDWGPAVTGFGAVFDAVELVNECASTGDGTSCAVRGVPSKMSRTLLCSADADTREDRVSVDTRSKVGSWIWRVSL